MIQITQEQNINPQMLKYARESAGYTEGYINELPILIKNNYKEWENGTKKPTWKQLEILSRKYQIPTIFFFRKTYPQKEELQFIEYRNKQEEQKSPNLIKSIKISNYRRENYIKLRKKTNKNIKTFKYHLNTRNVEKSAEYLRQILKTSVTTQINWNKDYSHYNVLKRWKQILNDVGILIFETEQVSTDEIRALSIYNTTYPIILLNGKDSVNGRIFSLFHELTHLLTNKSTMCDLDENNEKEVFCNNVAGTFLIPTNEINKEGVWNKKTITKTAHKYGVSQEVVLKRLKDMNIISEEEYSYKVDSIRKSIAELPKRKHGGGNYFYNKIKYEGEEYIKLIIEAYEDGLINDIEFSRYLNMKSTHLDEIKARIPELL